MTKDIFMAISYLHDIEKKTTSNYTLERIDRALDELFKNPQKVGNPKKIAFAAWGNAGKVLRNRAKFYKDTAVDFGDLANGCPFSTSDFEFIDVLNRSVKNERHLRIIKYLYQGLSAEEIADEEQVPVKQVRVWISRTRSYFRVIWEVA